MNRRGFLSVVGAALVAPIIPDFRIITEAQAILPAELVFTSVREFVAFDIFRDEWIVRQDVLVPSRNMQLGIDFVLESDFDGDDYKKNLELSKKRLIDFALEKGASISEIVAPPPILNYCPPSGFYNRLSAFKM